MKVVASVLNWNNIENTINCLQSLKKLKNPDLHICVSDNNSCIFDQLQIQSIISEVKIFVHGANIGYAAGHTFALKYAMEINADFFWMLNNDLTVFSDTLDALLQAHLEKGDALFGSASIDVIGEYTELELWQIDPENPQKTNFQNIDPSRFKKKEIIKTANVFGHSFFIPMRLIQKYGFMETSWFLYYEETDYCLRLLRNGIPSFWVGRSNVRHQKYGSSINQNNLFEVMEYYLYRNFFRLLFRHGTLFHIIHFLKRFLMRFLSANVARKNKVPFLTKKHLLGIFHAFIGVKGKYYAPEDYLNR